MKYQIRIRGTKRQPIDSQRVAEAIVVTAEARNAETAAPPTNKSTRPAAEAS